MDASRAQKIAQVLKDTKTLGKEIGKPVGGPAAAAASRAAIEATSRLPTGTMATTIMRYVMYFIATLLAIGLLVLAIDQWITPVFKRLPYSLPGIDKTQAFWSTSSSVQTVTIGVPPSKNTTEPYCTVLEGQEYYAITIDVNIDDEFPQPRIPTTGNTSKERIFFIIGSLASPKLQISLDNSINTVYVKSFSGDLRANPKAALLENVPVHTPFRIGVVVKPTYMEAYLNGKLYSTVQFDASYPALQLKNNDVLLPPSAITINSIAYGKGIQAMNLRTFGYVPSAEELLSRMDTLIEVKSFASTS
uniref:Uncharacterized protein n=1 Tax=viral metagenome TaxID=1070528 RepID=A0A6C0LSE4_9ZZZZ